MSFSLQNETQKEVADSNSEIDEINEQPSLLNEDSIKLSSASFIPNESDNQKDIVCSSDNSFKAVDSSSSLDIQHWLEGVDKRFIECDPFIVVTRLKDGSISEDRSNRMRAMPRKAQEYWSKTKHEELETTLSEIIEYAEFNKRVLRPDTGREAKSYSKILVRRFDKANRLRFELSCLSADLAASIETKFESVRCIVEEFCQSADNFITPSMSSTSWNSAGSLKEKQEEKAVETVENSIKSQFDKIRLNLEKQCKDTSAQIDSEIKLLLDKKEELLRQQKVKENSVSSQESHAMCTALTILEQGLERGDSLENALTSVSTFGNQQSKDCEKQVLNAAQVSAATDFNRNCSKTLPNSVSLIAPNSNRTDMTAYSKSMTPNISVNQTFDLTTNSNNTPTSVVTVSDSIFSGVSTDLSREFQLPIFSTSVYSKSTHQAGGAVYSSPMTKTTSLGSQASSLVYSLNKVSALSGGLLTSQSSSDTVDGLNRSSVLSSGLPGQFSSSAGQRLNQASLLSGIFPEHFSPSHPQGLNVRDPGTFGEKINDSVLPIPYLDTAVSNSKLFQSQPNFYHSSPFIPPTESLGTYDVGSMGQIPIYKNIDLPFNPNAREFVPIHSSNHDNIFAMSNPSLTKHDLTSHSDDSLKLLADVIERQKLPKHELPKFSGEPLFFNRWFASFQLLVDNQNISTNLKMFHLSNCLEGEALRAVEGCLLLNTDSSYHEALTILKRRFGDEIRISEAFRTKMDQWPNVKPDDAQSLRDFADFLVQCKAASSELSGLRVLEDTHYLNSMVDKLPKQLQDSWICRAQTIRDNEKRQPSFAEFVQFVEFRASAVKNHIGTAQSVKKPSIYLNSASMQDHLSRGEVVSFFENKDTFNETQGTSGLNIKKRSTRNGQITLICPLCSGNHYADKCKDIVFLSERDRNKLFKEKGLCTTCCRKTHGSKSCTTKPFCGICKQEHFTHDHMKYFHSQLKADLAKSSEQITDDNSANVQHSDNIPNSFASENLQNTAKEGQDVCLARIMPVKVSLNSDPSQFVVTLAFLDEGSDCSFIEENIIDKLNTTKYETLIESSSLHHKGFIQSNAVSGLAVSSLSCEDFIQLPVIFTHKSINLNSKSIPTQEIVAQFSHLENISDVFPKTELVDSLSIGLLIGRDTPEALKPLKCTNGFPYAVQSRLGWGVIGSYSNCSVEDGSDKRSNESYIESNLSLEENCSVNKIQNNYRCQIQNELKTKQRKTFKRNTVISVLLALLLFMSFTSIFSIQMLLGNRSSFESQEFDTLSSHLTQHSVVSGSRLLLSTLCSFQIHVFLQNDISDESTLFGSKHKHLDPLWKGWNMSYKSAKVKRYKPLCGNESFLSVYQNFNDAVLLLKSICDHITFSSDRKFIGVVFQNKHNHDPINLSFDSQVNSVVWHKAPDFNKQYHVVIIYDDNIPRNLWKLGLIEESVMSSDGKVRSVILRQVPVCDKRGVAKHQAQLLRRPIHKLTLLVANDSN